MRTMTLIGIALSRLLKDEEQEPEPVLAPYPSGWVKRLGKPPAIRSKRISYAPPKRRRIRSASRKDGTR